jgi:hypothetical protein
MFSLSHITRVTCLMAYYCKPARQVDPIPDKLMHPPNFLRRYMARAMPEVLEGPYTVLVKNRLQANEQTDPNKWDLWKKTWSCKSFEELARVFPDPVNTSRTNRRITWRTEVRWALKQGWIRKGL